MKSRKQILQKLKTFYNDIRNKTKGKRMRLQVDNEFQQVKIKDLNDLKTTSKCLPLLSEAEKLLLQSKK